ncbi:transmembrane protease serine 11C [Caerostris darwini]|uniref:Transmembrane protease serine 11C n=1 Tax=Caerostris darwini TaxID=1538125 RepID=A0AAV4PNP6_9ARAC|nr:transmembrane protease serine 11C [Caerostris darwini]
MNLAQIYKSISFSSAKITQKIKNDVQKEYGVVDDRDIANIGVSSDGPPCPCGSNTSLIHTRVVGGHDAGEGHFPYASCLMDSRWRAENITVPFCGATLITDSHVITAAHCVRERSPDVILVDIGDYDLLDPQQPRLRKAKSLISFPEYKDHSFHSDIALIEFERPVTWRSGVKAAWLPSPSLRLTEGTVVSVYGWGRLTYDGGHPKILQSVELPVMDNKKCQLKFHAHIEPSMICAGGQAGHDACIGDSGSGLVVRLDNDFVLCGLVSFGQRCALPHVPGVYTRISSYIDLGLPEHIDFQVQTLRLW